MDNKPLISVIIPMFNVEKYIERCIQSLCKQTYENIEIILINDGSQDKTETICLNYLSDNRIRLFSKENGGVSKARNFGLIKAHGEYIAFVDADDFVETHYIEFLYSGFINKNVDLVCCSYYKEYEINECNKIEFSFEKRIFSKEKAINALYTEKAFQGYLWNKLFKKEIIDKYNIKFDERVKIWEDMLFCLEYLNQIKTAFCINKLLYHYIIRENSAMGNSLIWNEGTHIYGLEKMVGLLRPYEGEMKNYINNFYKNDLVGQLGKIPYKNSKYLIYKEIKQIESIDGCLTKKHLLKFILFKYTPYPLLKFIFLSRGENKCLK